jgi:miniconductance mechanosensitive channel
LEQEKYMDKPIQSYFQAFKIVLSGVFFILILSALSDRSPLFFLTSLGAMAAILLLIFKDTILGFVASVQIAANDMIRMGDWITMEKFGADGSVVEINVATVKVQNFDKTITTIPTYSMVSDSFKNWRGMQESEGRRIKRSVSIQIDSIGFASIELLDRLKKSRLIRDFIMEREQEITQYNKGHELEDHNHLDSRRQTNIGLYRKYIEFYLKNNPHIHTDLDLMVRQLPSTEKGLPLEIYCFTNEKRWLPYEEIVSDIFDHILAVTHLFELHVFENPTGTDFRNITN